MKLISTAMMQDKLKRLPIKSKISFSFTLFFVVFLLILIVIINMLSSKIIITKTIQNFNQNLRLVSEKIDITINGLENYTKIAIINRDVQEILRVTKNREPTLEESRRVQQALISVIEPKTNIDTLTIFQSNGNHYEAKNSDSFDYTGSAVKSYIEKANSSQNKLYWLDTHKSLYQRGAQKFDVVSLIRMVVDANNGSNIGIIETLINEKHISGIYSNINIGASGEIFIINREGVIISHTNKQMLYSRVDNLPYYSWALNNNGVGKEFKIDNKTYLVVGKHYPRADWVIIGIAPTEEITSDSVTYTKTIFLIGFVFITLSIPAIELISLNITKPINRLKRTMEYVGQGDLQATADVGSKDEIGLLAEEFNKMVRRTSELLDRVTYEQTQKRDFELALIQSQINPHFLYNTLENICALADLKRNDDIIKVVNELASFYRGVLSKGNNIITISDEIHITDSYLKVLKMRYLHKLEYEFNIDGSINEYLTVKLLLQPIVENAIYHGHRNKKGKGTVIVNGGFEAGNIVFEVIDNGIGIRPEELEQILDDCGKKGKSFGLKSTNDRIKMYFGDEYGVSIMSTYGEGTTVKIVLPAQKKEGAK